LGKVGLPVTESEGGGTPQFGAATAGQLNAFEARYGLPVKNELNPTNGGVLYLASLAGTETDRTKLQAELKDSVGKVPDSPEYNYWLARYAIMAGDYVTAKSVEKPVNHVDGLFVDLGLIFNPQPRQPEVPHPENFYTYRDDLVDPGQLAQLRSQLESLTVEQYAAGSSTPGNTVDPKSIDLAWFGHVVNKARPAVAAIAAWQTGNHFAANRELTLAMQSYLQCQSSIIDYFQANDAPLTGNTGAQRLQALLARRGQEGAFPAFWNVLRWRRILLSLEELEDNDRKNTIGNDGAFASPAAFINTFTAVDEFGANAAAMNQVKRLDPLMIVMGMVWVPLAIGELNCQLRQFDAAIQGFNDIVNAQAGVGVPFRYLCEFIEIPLIRLLTLEALLGKADAEYKAGTTVDAQTFPDAPTYHGLLAAQTYEAVMSHIAEDGQYTANVTQGRDKLVALIHQKLQAKDTTSVSFRSVAKGITVPTIATVTSALPGLDRAVGPHQPMTTITAPDGRTTNPKVYSMGLLAIAKLEQIKAGFNYLGYAADYVPPWRFSYLLDRARYFAEHAKNGQRDYLNFLSNAEHEEFQEQSVAQNVEMENSNVRIESAKVDVANAEVAAAQAAADGATLHAKDANDAAADYLNFELQADEADAWSGLGSMFGDLVSMVGSAIAENPVGVIQGALNLGGTVEQLGSKQAERDFERQQLERTAVEAEAAATEARKKLGVANSSLVVAGLELQAAVLRHEFAVENLNYLRNRVLSADQWFRLANGIRGVSDSYLRYAIELAFLAQQAYEFESDGVVNVIRFDYDLSDVGAMLAADFLQRDLDSLEEDLVVGQKARQQQVRYVLSMARDYPEALRTLSETGEVMFGMRLEQWERHFPGLFNLRLSSVDVQPIALMDPSRISIELTQLGIGMIRLKAQPSASPLYTTDLPAGNDWLGAAGTAWPVKIHVSGPETAVFSGLSRQDAASLSTITANERGAFEGLPGASSWRLRMSTKENQLVPGTLADVLITFVVSGYYDAELNKAATTAAAAPRPLATTSYISARNSLPDSYYSLVNSGTLDWDISDGMLTPTGTPNEMRNLAVTLALVPNGPELGRCYSHYPVRIQIASGSVKVLTALPQFSFTATGLTLKCAFAGPNSTAASWDFGDGSPLAQGASVQHAYAGPGRYEVLARLVQDHTLVEYRNAVVVSMAHTAVVPLAVTPVFAASPAAADGTVTLTVSTPPGVADVSLDCSIGTVRSRADTGPATLKLTPGTYTLDFLATRKLSARFYSRQRYLPDDPVALYRGRIATNRTFDVKTGAETTTTLNAFGTRLFKNGAATATLSPVDRWTLELPLSENPWFATVSSSDVATFDGGELADAILSLEFMGPQ
jgi:hypothetical protein